MNHKFGVRGFLKLLGVVGIATSAAVAVPQLPPVTRKEDDASPVPFDDSDIIGSHDWKMQGSWLPLRGMDEYIYRYTKLEDMINEDPRNGHFWKTIRFVDEGNKVHALHATRNDGKQVVVRRTFEHEPTIAGSGEKMRMVDTDFHMLCGQLNDCLDRESA